MTAFLGYIKLIYEILMLAKSLASFVQDNKDEAWWQEFERVGRRLRDAKTPEERRQVGRDLARNWGKM